ncbi:hypothetical protein LOK49_LG15G02004 [Camellia lanceoleosa]|uniref:Uncharacterized protein n=1 Tax=Camellia lanceoleosa TaxID=1840588 RepID=A0ACC0F2L4_9ERIC|nr:hypothetical protein LOK49_LG15G02004 [Camellia lanceoleosa]
MELIRYARSILPRQMMRCTPVHPRYYHLVGFAARTLRAPP